MTDAELEAAPDEALLARIAAGESASLSVLFRRRQQNVYRFALHLTGSPAFADDVTQDVFVAVIRDAARFMLTHRMTSYQTGPEGVPVSVLTDAYDTLMHRFGVHPEGEPPLIGPGQVLVGVPELLVAHRPSRTDHDGMPDAWERANKLDPSDPADGSRDDVGDGYTNLERYLNSIVASPPAAVAVPAADRR